MKDETAATGSPASRCSSSSRQMSSCVHLGKALVSLAALAAFAGCTAQTQVVLTPPLPPQHQLLDLRIARVAIAGQRMTETLDKLSEQIRNESGGKLVFDYSMGEAVQKNNALISIDAQDVLLRTVLDDLCRQVKCTYVTRAPGLLPPGFYFCAPYELRQYPPQ
jgi:hypothetical protein